MDDSDDLKILLTGMTPEERQSIRSEVRALCVSVEADVRAKMRTMPDLTEHQWATASGLLSKIDRLRSAADALEQLCP